MMTRSLVHYQKMASAFTVRDIARLVPRVHPDTDISPTTGRPEGSDITYCWLVANEAGVYGYLTEQMLHGDACCPLQVRDLMEPLGHRAVVPASMPLLDIVPRLAGQHDWTLFVLTEKGITHVVTGEECDSMPVKLCILSLILELEEEMTFILWSQPDSLTRRIESLPSSRIQELYQNNLNQGRPEPSSSDVRDPLAALTWANVMDKGMMLYDDPKTRPLFGFLDDREGHDFFNYTRLVRNAIAHNRSLTEADDLLVIPAQLAGYINRLRGAILRLATERKAIMEHGDAKQN